MTRSETMSRAEIVAGASMKVIDLSPAAAWFRRAGKKVEVVSVRRLLWVALRSVDGMEHDFKSRAREWIG